MSSKSKRTERKPVKLNSHQIVTLSVPRNVIHVFEYMAEKLSKQRKANITKEDIMLYSFSATVRANMQDIKDSLEKKEDSLKEKDGKARLST